MQQNPWKSFSFFWLFSLSFENFFLNFSAQQSFPISWHFFYLNSSFLLFVNQSLRSWRPVLTINLPLKPQFFSIHFKYCKVGSTRPSHLEAHAGFFRLSMKRKFDLYVFTVTFWENFYFHIINTRYHSRLYGKQKV